MTDRHIWTRPGGNVLAWQRAGWPMPPARIDATIAMFDDHHGVRRTAEDITGPDGTWQCRGYRCDTLARWRSERVEHVTIGLDCTARFVGYYCDRHLPHSVPTDAPTPACGICRGPLDPVLATHGHTAHICCAPNTEQENTP